MDYRYWDTTDSHKGELTNNLILTDNIIEKFGFDVKPEFQILGGVAFIFNGVNYDILSINNKAQSI